MDKQKALKITEDRIDSLKYFTPTNQSEEEIAKETLEYLKFIKDLLETKE